MSELIKFRIKSDKLF